MITSLDYAYVTHKNMCYLQSCVVIVMLIDTAMLVLSVPFYVSSVLLCCAHLMSVSRSQQKLITKLTQNQTIRSEDRHNIQFTVQQI